MSGSGSRRSGWPPSDRRSAPSPRPPARRLAPSEPGPTSRCRRPSPPTRCGCSGLARSTWRWSSGISTERRGRRERRGRGQRGRGRDRRARNRHARNRRARDQRWRGPRGWCRFGGRAPQSRQPRARPPRRAWMICTTSPSSPAGIPDHPPASRRPRPARPDPQGGRASPRRPRDCGRRSPPLDGRTTCQTSCTAVPCGGIQPGYRRDHGRLRRCPGAGRGRPRYREPAGGSARAARHPGITVTELPGTAGRPRRNLRRPAAGPRPQRCSPNSRMQPTDCEPSNHCRGPEPPPASNSLTPPQRAA